MYVKCCRQCEIFIRTRLLWIKKEKKIKRFSILFCINTSTGFFGLYKWFFRDFLFSTLQISRKLMKFTADHEFYPFRREKKPIKGNLICSNQNNSFCLRFQGHYDRLYKKMINHLKNKWSLTVGKLIKTKIVF